MMPVQIMLVVIHLPVKHAEENEIENGDGIHENNAKQEQLWKKV